MAVVSWGSQVSDEAVQKLPEFEPQQPLGTVFSQCWEDRRLLNLILPPVTHTAEVSQHDVRHLGVAAAN